MESFIIIIMGLYLVPAISIALVTYIIFRGIYWAIELPLLVLPGILYWFLLEVLDLESAFRGKSLANLVEAILIGIIVGILFLLRSIAEKYRHMQKRKSIVLFALLSNLAAVLVFILKPCLPE